MSNDDMAKALNERSSYRIGKTRELTRYYSENELLKLMIALEDMDLKVKTSDVDPNFLLELFILNMWLLKEWSLVDSILFFDIF